MNFSYINHRIFMILIVLLSVGILSNCNKDDLKPDYDHGHKGGSVVKVVDSLRNRGKVVSSYTGSYALLIGESKYTNGWDSLGSIPGELQEVEKALKKQGFKVEKHLNLNAEQLRTTFRTFINQYGFDKNNRLLFFFGGHGHTGKYQGYYQGYIVPVDAPLPNYNLNEFISKAISMDEMNTWAKEIVNHALFVFDSCFSETIFKTRGISMMSPPSDTFIAYATTPGEMALDSGSNGRNSAYTYNILKYIQQPKLSLEKIFKKVRFLLKKTRRVNKYLSILLH